MFDLESDTAHLDNLIHCLANFFFCFSLENELFKFIKTFKIASIYYYTHITQADISNKLCILIHCLIVFLADRLGLTETK